LEIKSRLVQIIAEEKQLRTETSSFTIRILHLTGYTAKVEIKSQIPKNITDYIISTASPPEGRVVSHDGDQFCKELLLLNNTVLITS